MKTHPPIYSWVTEDSEKIRFSSSLSQSSAFSDLDDAPQTRARVAYSPNVPGVKWVYPSCHSVHTSAMFRSQYDRARDRCGMEAVEAVTMNWLLGYI